MQKIKYAVIVIVLIGGAFLLSSVLSSQNKEDLRKPSGNPPAPKTVKIQNSEQNISVNTSGRMYAYEKVDLFAEVSGVLEPDSKRFRSGSRYKAGEVMISINSDVFKNNLLAQKSNLLNQLTLMLPDLKIDFPDAFKKWSDYLENFELQKPLAELPGGMSKQENFYVASHNIFKLYYDIKSMEATFEKYTIEAPFDGLVVQSNINPGTLVRNGQKLGVFINTSLFELEAPIKISEVEFLKIGAKAVLTSYSNHNEITGKIVRINRAVDPESQSVNVYIQSTSNSILDGMFFNVSISAPTGITAARIPISALRDNNKVEVKTNGGSESVEVEVVRKSAVECWISGLEDNTEILLKELSN